MHAEDYHRVVEAVARAGGHVGSSGGGMCGLHWAVAHPEDVRTFVSTSRRDHAARGQPDGDQGERRHRRHLPAGRLRPAMAKFIQLVMHQGLLPDDYLDQPAPDPAQFGCLPRTTGPAMTCCCSGNLAMPPFEPDADGPALIIRARRARDRSPGRGRSLGEVEAVPAARRRTGRSSPATTAASLPTSGPRQRPGRVRREAARGAGRGMTTGPPPGATP